MEERGGFRFESVDLPDGVIEERATELGEEEYPLRRSVGGPLFGNDAEKEAWIKAQAGRVVVAAAREAEKAERGVESPMEILEDTSEFLKKLLTTELEVRLKDHRGDRAALEASIRKSLSGALTNPGETFDLDIPDDARSVSADITIPTLRPFDKIRIEIQ